MMNKEQAFDYGKVAGILFVSIFGVLLLLNSIVPNFFISIGPLLFIGLMGLGLWAVFKMYQNLSAKAPSLEPLETIIIFGGVIAAVVFVLIKYPQISPPIASIARQVQSMVGLI